MAKYGEGDIVLLNGSRLGIMTSSNTVRVIRGDMVEMTQIVKKLSAKDLAESLVDLMERYNNLENKNTTSSSSQSSSSTNNNNNNNINNNNMNKHKNLKTPKRSMASHQYKVSQTDTTQNTMTNTTTTSGTKSSKDTKSSNKTGTTTTTNTNRTTSSSSEPKPTTIHLETTQKTELEIPKTPNLGNHAFSPTDSNYYNHYFYGPHPQTLIYPNKQTTKQTTKRTISNVSDNESTISSLSPANFDGPSIYNSPHHPHPHHAHPHHLQHHQHQHQQRTLHKMNKPGKSSKTKKKSKFPFSRSSRKEKNKNKSSPNETFTNRSRFSSPFRKNKKLAKTNSVSSDSHHIDPIQSINAWIDYSYSPQPEQAPLHENRPTSTPALNDHDDDGNNNNNKDNQQQQPHNNQRQQQHHQLPPYYHLYGHIPHPHPHHYHHPAPYPPYHQHLSYQHPYGQYASFNPNNTNNHHHRHHNNIYPSLYTTDTSEYDEKNPLPFSHVRSNPEDHYERQHHGDTLLVPEQSHTIKTRISRSRSTDTYPNRERNDDSQLLQRFNPYFISNTPSHKTGASTITPPIPSPNAYHHHHGYHHHQQHLMHHNNNRTNPLHPPWHQHNLSAVSPSAYSSATPSYLPYNPQHTQSNPNPNPHSIPNANMHSAPQDGKELTDILLRAPDKDKKQKKKQSSGKATNNQNNTKKKSQPLNLKLYKRRAIKTNTKDIDHSKRSVATIMTSRTNLTQSPEPSSSHERQQQQQQQQQAQYVTVNPLNLLKSPDPESIQDPIFSDGSGRYRQSRTVNNSREHIKNTSNTMDSKTTINSEPLREFQNNYLNENSFTNSSYNQQRGSGHPRDKKLVNHYQGYNNDSLQFDSISARDSSHSPHLHANNNKRKGRPYDSPRGQQYPNRPFSAKHHNNNNKNDKNKHIPTKSNTKSVTYSEIEGKEFSSQNRTIRPFYPSQNKPKLSQRHNAYSTPIRNVNQNVIIQPTVGYKDNGNNRWHHQAKTLGNVGNILNPIDFTKYQQNKHDNTNYQFEEDIFHITEDFDHLQNTEKSVTDTVVVHNKENRDPNNEHEGSPFVRSKSPSFSILGNIDDTNNGDTLNLNLNINIPHHHQQITSMDDMTPLILSPNKSPNKHRRQQRSKSVVMMFDPIQPSHLSDIHHPHHSHHHHSYNTHHQHHQHHMPNIHPPIHIKASASDELDILSDEMNDVMEEHGYQELSKNINKRNKNRKHNNQTKKDPQYKIVLKTEDSNRAYYIQDNIKTSANKLSKPRFSQSTSKGSTATAQSAQSAQSNNSFASTISKTPSYLREDARWQKSMTHNFSENSTNSKSSASESFMLHKYININGNTEESQNRKNKFNFPDHDDEDDQFPNISHHHHHHHSYNTNNTNDTVKIRKKKPKIPPKLSRNDIATEHELKKSIRLKKKQQYHNNMLSPTATTATSATSTTNTVTVTNQSDETSFVARYMQ